MQNPGNSLLVDFISSTLLQEYKALFLKAETTQTELVYLTHAMLY